MKNLILDSKNWQLGSLTEDDSSAGVYALAGLSPDIKGQNYFKGKADFLAGRPSPANLTGDASLNAIILGIVDPAPTGASAPRDTILVSQAGEFYYTYGNVGTLFQTDSVDSNQYFKGRGAIKYFKGDFYISKGNDIVKIKEDLGYTFKWWTLSAGSGGAGQSALNSANPHPMEVIEDTLYIADGNKINTWDGITGATAQFSLGAGFVITSLIAHSDGRYLKVFATNYYSPSHGNKAQSKMFLVDTVGLQYVNSYDLEEQVEGSINLGGVCYCTYGETLGYFDGSGLQPIRTLQDIGPYWSPQLYTFGNSLLLPSSNYVAAFGNPSGKGNIFFYPYYLESNGASPYYEGSSIFFVMPIAPKILLIQYLKYVAGTPTMRYAKLDFNNYGLLNAQTTKIDPGSKIWIRKLDIFTEALPSGCSITIYNKQDDGSLVTIGTLVNSVDGSINHKTIFCNVLTYFIHPFLFGSSAPLIKKLNFQYESAE